MAIVISLGLIIRGVMRTKYLRKVPFKRELGTEREVKFLRNRDNEYYIVYDKFVYIEI